jgi:hypothetical protein
MVPCRSQNAKSQRRCSRSKYAGLLRNLLVEHSPGSKLILSARLLLARSGRFASEPEAVALNCALRFVSPPNSRPSMVCLCRASWFCRLLSSYRYCRSSRRLHRLINGRRHAGTATASCRAIISHRITAFQITPRKLQFCAWRAATGALGISIQYHVITGTMATGTISAGLASMAVATMAAVSALAGRGRRSGRSGIAAD